MAKVSQLEKAIQALKAERAVLDLAIDKLEAQMRAKPLMKQSKPKFVQRETA